MKMKLTLILVAIWGCGSPSSVYNPEVNKPNCIAVNMHKMGGSANRICNAFVTTSKKTNGSITFISDKKVDDNIHEIVVLDLINKKELVYNDFEFTKDENYFQVTMVNRMKSLNSNHVFAVAFFRNKVNKSTSSNLVNLSCVDLEKWSQELQ